MASFEIAMTTILEHEGGYSNHAADPGGATMMGISLRFLRQTNEYDLGDVDKDGDLDVEDIKDLTIEDVYKIYKKHWWDKYGYDRIISQQLATKIFDLAVNMGGRQAHKLVQRAARSVGVTLIDDGVLGNRSWMGIESIERSGRQAEFVAAIRSEAAGFYRYLAKAKPEFEVFLKGWLNRAYN